jgi:hypothetical protein
LKNSGGAPIMFVKAVIAAWAVASALPVKTPIGYGVDICIFLLMFVAIKLR